MKSVRRGKRLKRVKVNMVKLRKVQRILGTKTELETIERALELAIQDAKYTRSSE